MSDQLAELKKYLSDYDAKVLYRHHPAPFNARIIEAFETYETEVLELQEQLDAVDQDCIELELRIEELTQELADWQEGLN